METYNSKETEYDTLYEYERFISGGSEWFYNDDLEELAFVGLFVEFINKK